MKPFFIFFFIVVLFSCKTENQQEYIAKSLMAEIIADMELAQATYKFQPIDQRSDLDFMFEEIYKRHQVSKDVFNESLKFYSSSPKEIDEIYNEAIVLISRKQADLLVK